MMKKLALLICLLLCPFPAKAGIVYDPFDGSWAAPGTTAFLFYASHGRAERIYVDGRAVVRDANFKQSFITPGIVTWQQLGPIPYQVCLLLPYGKISMGSAESRTRLGDPQLKLAVRALKWDTGYVTLDSWFMPPLGEYDHKASMNVGNNRWQFRPTLTIGQDWRRFHFDFMVSYNYYTNNRRFGVNRDILKKDGDFFVELHTSYMLLPERGTYCFFSLGGRWGGRETINGMGVTGSHRDYSAKVGLGTNVTDTLTLLISFAYDIRVENVPKSRVAMFRLAKYF